MTPGHPTKSKPKPKACLGCSKARRACSKHTPKCRRCTLKGIECQYPLTRPPPVYQSLPPAVTGNAEDGEEPTDELENSAAALLPQRSQSGELNACLGSPNQLQIAPGIPGRAEPWFLAPAFWKMECQDPARRPAIFSNDALFCLIRQAQSWLRQWADRGSNPFIHAQLYYRQLPECILDAYTAVTAYVHRTPATTALALRIMTARANKVVQQQPTHSMLDGTLEVVMIDTFSHVARTQALLIYQLVRLYDGDIQARAEAEVHMEVLELWACQMWNSAALDVGAARRACTEGHDVVEDGALNTFHVDGSPTGLWHAWILAESVHRTYLLVMFVQKIYQTLRSGWSTCPGSVPLTVRNGLWDKPSAYSWSMACQEPEKKLFTCFLHEFEMFEATAPDEVDEFTVATMVSIHGLERMEQWAGEQVRRYAALPGLSMLSGDGLPMLI